MPTLVAPANLAQCQIDDFPEKCERSPDRKGRPNRGALYIRPASTFPVTDDEWKHMQAKHPHVAKLLIVAASTPTLNARLQARAASEKDPKVKAKLEDAISPKTKSKPAHD